MTILKGAPARAVFVIAAVAAFALIAGSSRSAADTTSPQCNRPDPQGRNFCVTIEDLDDVSPSGTFGTGKTQTTVTAFQFYHVIVQNNAGSTLTNGTLSVNLTDVTPTGNVNFDGVLRRGGLCLVLHANVDEPEHRLLQRRQPRRQQPAPISSSSIEPRRRRT